MPPALHAELARAAEREGVSLNGFITSKLGESVGWSRAEPRSPSVDRRAAPRTIVLVLIANAVAVAFAAAAALVILLVAVLS